MFYQPTPANLHESIAALRKTLDFVVNRADDLLRQVHEAEDPSFHKALAIKFLTGPMLPHLAAIKRAQQGDVDAISNLAILQINPNALPPGFYEFCKERYPDQLP